jgi:hypothetical protein
VPVFFAVANSSPMPGRSIPLSSVFLKNKLPFGRQVYSFEPIFSGSKYIDNSQLPFPAVIICPELVVQTEKIDLAALFETIGFYQIPFENLRIEE